MKKLKVEKLSENNFLGCTLFKNNLFDKPYLNCNLLSILEW